MLEYPPDVSVRSPSGAELGDDPDCRRDEDGRTGVERSADPEPGAWTADEVMPAVYRVSVLLHVIYHGICSRTSSSDGMTGSCVATIDSSSGVGGWPTASVLSLSVLVARTAAAGAAVSAFGEEATAGVTTGLTSLGVEVLVSTGVVFLAAAEVDALEPGVCVFVDDAPFFGSGSSNSSADKHPILSRNPEKPDRFFFLCAGFFAAFDRVALAGAEEEEVAAGVFSVVTGAVVVFGFLSPLAEVLLLDDNLRVRVSIGPLPVPAFFCPSTKSVLESVVCSFSIILSSLISPGMGNGSATLLLVVDVCGVEGVAGVSTNSGLGA